MQDPSSPDASASRSLGPQDIRDRLRQIRGVIANTIQAGSYYDLRMMVGRGRNRYLVMICVDDLPSRHGIAGGRITKLWVFDGDKPNRVNHMYAYDRKLDLAPQQPEVELLVRRINEALTVGDELPETDWHNPRWV